MSEPEATGEGRGVINGTDVMTGAGGSPAALARLIALASGRRSIVALTGAGISTESGIPDYRGPQGVWTTGKLPRLDDFATNRDTRLTYWSAWRGRYDQGRAIRPNAGHLALLALERAGLLLAIVTQNIDGLHIAAGNDPGRVLELHGTRRRLRCLALGHVWPADEVYGWAWPEGDEPLCPTCGSPLRGGTVLFGEPLPADVLRRATAATRACDLMLVVGSSLVVNPAARLPRMARQAGAATALINREPTGRDADFDVVVLDEAGPALTALITALGLRDPGPGS